MTTKKHILHLVLVALCVALLCGVLWLLVPRTAQSQFRGEGQYAGVSFSVDNGELYFFEHATGRVYVYSPKGSLRDVLQISQLGQRLEEISKHELRKESVSTLEQDQFS